jgi:hypothetical protein
MKKPICATTLLLCVAMLTGCLVPERFSAKVEVQPDASYTFKYAGTVVHALAAAQIKKSGPLSEKDQNGLKLEADKLSKQPDVKRATYKGDARYDLEVESKKKAGEKLRMFDIFTVSTDKDGVMTIASTEIKEKERRELEQLGITIDGTLEVSLPKNAEVISQNATSTPSFMGMFGTYSWKIGRIDQQPLLKMRLKS